MVRSRNAIIEMRIYLRNTRTGAFNPNPIIHEVEGVYLEPGRYPGGICFSDLQMAAVVDIVNNIKGIQGTFLREGGGWRWRDRYGSSYHAPLLRHGNLYRPIATTFSYRLNTIQPAETGAIQYRFKDYLGRRLLRKGGTA